ncbi:MAG: radical SAM family heme chaperone HemW [Planctomycetota bacterium]|jgi:oxygen-independent coproporphyrinogen-3 oxidase|nr:radical SAM family heme chaperone HemW [Planctomycetota bacterium]MDP6762694.1 radical SAM family heme chaperone HemW [Planctomycetota bacterium]MDP6988946.1 radical SAM family heme chaperone HemW [Planctomycetota bacterium]
MAHTKPSSPAPDPRAEPATEPDPRLASGGRAPEGTPLYLHLPFCVALCHYCDFFSVTAEGQDIDGVLEALLCEARLRAPASPRTVYLGGGTPSLPSAAQLRRLLDGLDACCGFRASAVEVTAECNPESLDAAKAAALLAGGVDRLSVGVQSLRPRLLEQFGRVHSASEGLDALAAAREAGCENLSADLIFAAPGLDAASWREDLAALLELGLDHLSAYNLAFEEQTPFARRLARGELVAQPEACELEQFRITRELCSDAGLEPYEISSFASRGRRCEHNRNYWANGSYVGLGPSAVSHVGGVRFGNPRAIAPWREAVCAGRPAAQWSERLDADERLGETWWLGLRTAEGVDPRLARRTAGFVGRDDPAGTVAADLIAEGLLEERAGRVRLSERGLPLADAVAARFLGGF